MLKLALRRVHLLQSESSWTGKNFEELFVVYIWSLEAMNKADAVQTVKSGMRQMPSNPEVLRDISIDPGGKIGCEQKEMMVLL